MYLLYMAETLLRASQVCYTVYTSNLPYSLTPLFVLSSSGQVVPAQYIQDAQGLTFIRVITNLYNVVHLKYILLVYTHLF